jgi:hypothetical protein
MSGWRRWLHLALILAAIGTAYFVVPVSTDMHAENVSRGLIAVLLLFLLAAGVVRQLRLHLDDTSRHVDGLIVTIVFVMAVFSYCFYVFEIHDPTEFAGLETRLDAAYFTMATAATVGFGDVHAVGQMARGFVLAQMIFNVVFIGTAVALLSTRIREAASVRAQDRTTQRNPK